MNNRALAAVLAVCILLVAGFAVFITGGDDRVKEEKWYNVEIIDNVYPSYSSMSYQDNFYAYANEAYYLAGLEAGDKDEAMKIISANSVNNSFKTNIESDIIRIFDGEVSIDDLGDVDVLEAYNQFNHDMAARDEAGIDAIKTYVLEIDSISTLDGMTDYIITGGSAAMKRALVSATQFIEVFEGHNALSLNAAGLPGLSGYTEAVSSSSETQNLSIYKGMLDRFEDIDSESYMDAIKTINSKVKDSLVNNTTELLTYTDLQEYEFPFAGNLSAYHDSGINHFVGGDSGWINTLIDNYTEDNIMLYKSMAMYSLLMDAAYHLDSTAYDLLKDVKEEDFGPASTIFYDSKGSMSLFIGKYYTNAYTDEELIAWFDSLVGECKEAARDYFTGVSWIGTETKAKISEKIDKMIVRALGPMGDQLEYMDYSGIKADSYYDLIVKIRERNEENSVAMASQDIHQIWNPSFNPTEFNMFYVPNENSINLLLGYVREFLRPIEFDYNSNREYILGTIAISMCHEITHGFDNSGYAVTIDGVYDENWLFTSSEKETFNDRVEALTKYVTGFYVGNDSFLHRGMVGEVIADMGGTAITSTMIKPGDDPQKYFKSLAYLELDIRTSETYYSRLSDIHPPGMYRMNMEMQQLKLFYDTYGIKEGDNMFLSEEDRVNVW